MKKTKNKPTLFDELKEGFEALAAEREGKLTLRSHTVELRPPPKVTIVELLTVRQQLHLSRSVFARYLRTNARTLENWEQGRAKPNAQAVLLIKLVKKFPDTIRRLATI
jgi:putative transcriptional regulator